MDQEISIRVQQTLERVGEDESLTSDLTDPAAAALLDWINQQVQAADAATDDAVFQQRVASIRLAARTAAKTAADEDVTAAVVVERAQAALHGGESAAPSQPVPQPLPAAQPAPTAAPAPAAAEVHSAGPVTVSGSPRAQSARPTSVWNSLRRRLRRWVHRKV